MLLQFIENALRSSLSEMLDSAIVILGKRERILSFFFLSSKCYLWYLVNSTCFLWVCFKILSKEKKNKEKNISFPSPFKVNHVDGV